MGTNVWVKVVGFNDVERHSLNTLFRLSRHKGPCYLLWTPECPALPHVVLVDVESYEAGLELASPKLNPNTKLIAVGETAPPNAWRTLARPVDWGGLVQVLDDLFNTHTDLDVDFDFADTCIQAMPPGLKNALLVGVEGADVMYLRTRLALAGLMTLDVAPGLDDGRARLAHRNYDVVMLNLDPHPEVAWMLAEQLATPDSPAQSVILMTDTPTWSATMQAEALGCAGLLERPFIPQQVWSVLQKV
jgi:hypothetical protein